MLTRRFVLFSDALPSRRLVLAIFAILLLPVALVGHRTSVWSAFLHDEWRHGWPYNFLRRDAEQFSYFWHVTSRIKEFRLSNAMIDSAILFGMSFLVAVAIGMFRRRGVRWYQLTLKETLGASLLFGVAIALINRSVLQQTQNRAMLNDLSSSGAVIHAPVQSTAPDTLIGDGVPPSANEFLDVDVSHVPAHALSATIGILPLIHNISGLCCSEAGLDDHALRSIGSLSSLHSLNLLGTNVTGKSLCSLRQLSRLECLNLDYTGIADDDIEMMSDFEGMRELHLRGCRISGHGLRYLSKLHSLEYLDVSQTQTVDSGTTFIAELANLRGLFISKTLITSVGLSSLGCLTELEILDFDPLVVDDDTMQHIAHLEHLRKLNLSYNKKIGDEGFRTLSMLSGLETLCLRGTRISDVSVYDIAGCAHLTTLDLGESTVTDRAVAILIKLPQLEHLDLFGTRITDTALISLSRCQHLQDVDCRETQVTESGIAILKRMAPRIKICSH